MAHTTQNGTSTAMATEYTGDESPGGIKADAVLRSAERAVAFEAPFSGEAGDQAAYLRDASDAELAVFQWLVLRPDRIKDQALGDLKTSYFGNAPTDEYEVARSAMTRWLPQGALPDTDAPVAVITNIPW